MREMREEAAPRIERAREESTETARAERQEWSEGAEGVERAESAERPERRERRERGERSERPERRRGGRGRRERDREGRGERRERGDRFAAREAEPSVERAASGEAPAFESPERHEPPVTVRAPEVPQAAGAAGPSFGRKGKPNPRQMRRDTSVAPPPAAAAAVAEEQMGTPKRHGPISSSDWLQAELPKPEVHIIDSASATPPGAPSDRYRVAESGPGGPRRPSEDESREQSA